MMILYYAFMINIFIASVYAVVTVVRERTFANFLIFLANHLLDHTNS